MLYDPKWDTNLPLAEPQHVLMRAADLIAARGHCKGRLRDDEGRMCARGAIIEAMGGRNNAFRHGPKEFYRVDGALEAYVGTPVAFWNNAPERTAAEVCATLRAAAVAP